MNNKNIEVVKNEVFPFMPELSAQNRSRILTKHFTNTALYLNPNQYALLSWLIYQSNQDNSIRYNTHLLTRYRESVLSAGQKYNGWLGLNISLPYIRAHFSWLIKNGYLLKCEDKLTYLINPMLSYRDEYVRPKEYTEFVRVYQSIQFGSHKDIEGYCKDWRNTINQRIKKKKK